jgi:hypothetical protein
MVTVYSLRSTRDVSEPLSVKFAPVIVIAVVSRSKPNETVVLADIRKRGISKSMSPDALKPRTSRNIAVNGGVELVWMVMSPREVAIVRPVTLTMSSVVAAALCENSNPHCWADDQKVLCSMRTSARSAINWDPKETAAPVSVGVVTLATCTLSASTRSCDNLICAYPPRRPFRRRQRFSPCLRWWVTNLRLSLPCTDRDEPPPSSFLTPSKRWPESPAAVARARARGESR